MVISSRSMPAHSPGEGCSDIYTNASTCFGVGAVIQGMMRVFRSETGLGGVVWGLDLPDLAELSYDALEKILFDVSMTQL